MSVRSLSIINARDKLTSLPEELASQPGAVTVTRRGEPVLAILSYELYEAIMETLEVMSDEKLMAALRRDLKEAGGGKTIPLERALKAL